jgi:uncharacterized repeat protein (TIGR03803 family)
MKKIYFLSTALFLCFLATKSQRVYQMWGTSREGGSANIGTIFSIAPDGSNLQTRYSFAVKNPGIAPNYSELVESMESFMERLQAAVADMVLSFSGMLSPMSTP